MAQAQGVSCGQQARLYSDVTVEDLAGNWRLETGDHWSGLTHYDMIPDDHDCSGYLDDTTFFPKRMSYMAEMMYT